MIAYFNLIILFRRIDQTKRFNAVLKHRNIKPAWEIKESPADDDFFKLAE
jgi:hypothetical protein